MRLFYIFRASENRGILLFPSISLLYFTVLRPDQKNSLLRFSLLKTNPAKFLQGGFPQLCYQNKGHSKLTIVGKS